MRYKSYTVVVLGLGIGAFAVSVVVALRMADVNFVVLYPVMLLFFVASSIGGIAFARLMKKILSTSSLRYRTLLASWFALCVLWAVVVFMLLLAASLIGAIAFARLMKKILSTSSLRYGTLLASWFALCVLWSAVVFVLLVVVEAATLFFVTTAVTACLMLVVGPPTLRRLKGLGR